MWLKQTILGREYSATADPADNSDVWSKLSYLGLYKPIEFAFGPTHNAQIIFLIFICISTSMDKDKDRTELELAEHLRKVNYFGVLSAPPLSILTKRCICEIVSRTSYTEMLKYQVLPISKLAHDQRKLSSFFCF